MALDSILVLTVEVNGSKVRTAYFKAGWTDNNVPKTGPKAKTMVMTADFATTMAANLNRRIKNGERLWTGRSFRTEILSASVEAVR
jgi:hypothetical protein